MTMQPHTGGTAPLQPYLVSIGNVHATQEWVVTPAGSWRAASINVTTQDQTATTTHTPGWAIVMVVLFIWFFLLSLLFLLAREVRVTGYVNVTIWGPEGQSYTENVPVWNAAQRADVFNRVAYLQGIIGHQRGAAAR
ncbi:hypothetical protein [Microbacterium sp. 2RAF4]|uniref:hypothetical protein n=1 Tax=Microbacterium sp. 2RAF4 TaxID=3232999 RepID=UPI003F9B21C4